MEFTKENWENAPEGAVLEYIPSVKSYPVHLVGWTIRGDPVIQPAPVNQPNQLLVAEPKYLRITLPKRKVTVQLWQLENGALCSTVDSIESAHEYAYTLLGEHTFEIEGE